MYVNSPFPISQGALGKRKEFEGMLGGGKVGQAEVTEIGQRTDTLSYALLAEINTFHSQRLKDMKLVHQQFLQEQIKFYQKVHTKVPMLNIVYLCCRSQKGCKRH